MKRFFTIGMAGHIDHGKTTLTKALTNVDTDRLKEEKERQISIELGFAPLYEDDELQISVIDVPGHERFIRQMIAGVAGIDLVVLVVAADEGVMPQTKEHLEILGFLGIKQGIVAITKSDRVEEEFIQLVQEDIKEELVGTVFEDAPFMLTDSLSLRGITELKEEIISKLKEQDTRDVKGEFRLPIDQVFSVKGQGTVVRGTVYEGAIEEGQALTILPRGLEVRARQLQVHHKQASLAFAGQRVAINLAGASKDEMKRGDVLVSSEHFAVTRTIDVSIKVVDDLEYMVKQRMPIKCHIGTSEVMGRIVFFDRNDLTEDHEEILCQLRLDEEIVAKRGDRFILRRPSPQETIGGGWVIDPNGRKYRFGLNTIEELDKKKMGTPEERVIDLLTEEKSLSVGELVLKTSLDEGTIKEILQNEPFVQVNKSDFTLKKLQLLIEEEVYDQLNDYHQLHPLKQGLKKAELLQSLQNQYPKALLEFVINKGEEIGLFIRNGQFIRHQHFTPHVPSNWQKRTENMLLALQKDGMQVSYFNDYYTDAGLPENLQGDVKKFLQDTGEVVALDDVFYWHGNHFRAAVEKLKQQTANVFDVGEAKEILGLSRKYMIPFLERLDALGMTYREENKRVWKRE
ncbi:selenocysteine-specific translation elongation factor [Cytobacillus gottheilii]|uniref:selenocysteine-specific translation elongation factor n=1 Tax=Cytobacillus gottheilii TaxID=859144 RepID=UPI0009BBC347|nr:selenocysteine-specific translation elongation factor [Cytobacillus gottheilii]